MDNIELLLEIAKSTQQTIEKHIVAEDQRFDKIDRKLDQHGDDISELKTSAAVTRAKFGLFSAVIAAFVAGISTWLANIFGLRG